MAGRIDELKGEGNRALAEGRNYEAVSKYSEALKELGDTGGRAAAILCSNRSLAWTKIGKREKAVHDADLAIQKDPSYFKARYRKAKALLHYAAFDEALKTLAEASTTEINEVQEVEKLKVLISEKRSAALKEPSISHFEVIRELGTGNYSTILQVRRKSDDALFALKLIQKVQIEKIERRHPNVHNEILMEKRVLHKLKGHPNIIDMIATFQDADTLYYQMELMEGGELWAKLDDEASGRMIPLSESMARFYLSELVRALAHCHSMAIVHRDVKPENLLLTKDGRLKLIDFGTCKDLKQTDLNGPEFVGTPEYMSPEMVEAKPPADHTADLWALGVVAYQLLVGATPFAARSPYFTFLKIKRTNLRYPAHLAMNTQAHDFISRLIVKEPRDARLGAKAGTLTLLDHPFLHDTKSKNDIVRIPTLRDLCLKAATRYAVQLSNENILIEEAKRSAFGPSKFLKNPADRFWIYHYLQKTGQIYQNPKLLRLFFDSVLDARSLRADPNTRIYLGHSRDDHGSFTDPFQVALITAPAIKGIDDSNLAQLQRAVTAINRIRPPALFCIGNLATSDEGYTLFRKTMARVSESIPVVYCPGPDDPPASYRRFFGANYYAFWLRGARFIVLDLDHLDGEQTKFIQEEFEINSLGSHRVFLLAHTPPLWSIPHDATPDHESLIWAKQLLKARVDAILSACTIDNKIKSISHKDIVHLLPADDNKDTPANDGDGIDGDDASSVQSEEDINADAHFTIISTSPLPGGIGDEERIPAGLRLLTIYEQNFTHAFYPLEEVSRGVL